MTKPQYNELLNALDEIRSRIQQIAPEYLGMYEEQFGARLGNLQNTLEEITKAKTAVSNVTRFLSTLERETEDQRARNAIVFKFNVGDVVRYACDGGNGQGKIQDRSIWFDGEKGYSAAYYIEGTPWVTTKESAVSEKVTQPKSDGE